MEQPIPVICREFEPGQTYSQIVTDQLNEVDPQAWLADVLAPNRRASG